MAKRYEVETRRVWIGYVSTYAVFETDSFVLGPGSWWWRPTRRWAERKAHRMAQRG